MTDNNTVGIDKLTRSNYVLRGRCLDLCTERAELRARLTELESQLVALRYALKYATKKERADASRVCRFTFPASQCSECASAVAGYSDC